MVMPDGQVNTGVTGLTENLDLNIIDEDEEKTETLIDTSGGIGISTIWNFVKGNIGGRTECDNCGNKFYRHQVKGGLCVNCRGGNPTSN